MQDNNKKSPVHYPRSAAYSQLTTKKTYLEYVDSLKNELAEVTNVINNFYDGEFSAPLDLISQRDKLQKKLDAIYNKECELSRKNYDYNCGYSFLFDGIAVLCTFYNESIEILPNNYYMVRLTPDMLEQICLGPYISNSKIKAVFWDNFIKVAREPKTLAMVTDEGIYHGEPIRILIRHKDGRENRSYSTQGNKGQELINLKNVTGNPIDFIQLEFFTPMFRAVVDYQKNWIPLPQYLQAILYDTKFNNPELFSFIYTSKYDKEDGQKYTLSIDIVRKYFLYVTAHNNNIGDFMTIDAIDFFKQIKPSEIVNDKYLKRWYLAKQAMDAFCNLHRVLVNKNKLEGIKFNTGRVTYNGKTKCFTVAVKREKPMEITDEQLKNQLPQQEATEGFIENNDFPIPEDIQF